MKKIKENKKTIISLIIVIIVITISVSYAFFRFTTEEDEANQFKAACYDIDYDEPEGTGVEILNAYPITDEEAEEEKGYKFTVTNNCEETIKYNVIMNIKEGSTTDENLIRVSLNDEVNELSELTKVDSTLSDTKYGYKLKNETLEPTQVKEYEVKAWLGEDTQLGQGENTIFLNQISIEILKETKGILVDKIIANNPPIEKTPDFTLGEPSGEGFETLGSGLYKTEENDDYGAPSYYFRGDRNELKNNIKFAKMKWKIVRINGDGSIRLILADDDWNIKSIGDTEFNPEFDKQFYAAGFTYNNETHYCTKEQPCEVAYADKSFSNTDFGGENSTIKTTLETWYSDNLDSVNDKIDLGYFCNDTSSADERSGYIYYGANERIVNSSSPSYGKPTLQCPEPKDKSNKTRDYGGLYKTKIGLLTVDEMNMAGLPDGILTYTTESNYLYYNGIWRSMSPELFDTYSINIFMGGYGSVNGYDLSTSLAIIPVINLKANVKATGSGTPDDPFVVK